MGCPKVRWAIVAPCVDLSLLVAMVVFEHHVRRLLRGIPLADTAVGHAIALLAMFLAVRAAVTRLLRGSFESPRLPEVQSAVFRIAIHTGPAVRLLLLAFAPWLIFGDWRVLLFYPPACVFWVLVEHKLASKQWRASVKRCVVDNGGSAALAELRRLAGGRGVGEMRFVLTNGRGMGRLKAGCLSTGRRMTVYLWRELFEELTPEELRAVFAHELGHHELRHGRKTIALALSVEILAALAVVLTVIGMPVSATRWEWASFLPVVALIWYVTRLLLWPFVRSSLRRQELAADRRALEITKDPEAFASAYRKLALRGGASGRAARWIHRLFDEAPSLSERLDLVKRYTGGLPDMAHVTSDVAPCSKRDGTRRAATDSSEGR